MLNRAGLLLYLCTDRLLSLGKPLLEAVEAAIRGGVTMVQLREKEAASCEFYELALQTRHLTKKLGIPLVVNDRLDIALAVEADGLHIGQSDLPLTVARQLARPNMFIGVSVGCLEEALAAEQGGADYLGVGAIFATGSKADAGEAIGLAALRDISARTKLPLVAIGGINAVNAAQVREAGADGIAVISAILSQPDIEAAATALRQVL